MCEELEKALSLLSDDDYEDVVARAYFDIQGKLLRFVQKLDEFEDQNTIYLLYKFIAGLPEQKERLANSDTVD